MTPDEFRATLAAATPPAALSIPLAGLWWCAKGDWERAHRLVQSADDGDAAWVHAHLHRVEGDLDNAAYWYRQAGLGPATGTLEKEWMAITAALLARMA